MKGNGKKKLAYVDVTTIAFSVELVVATNVHAVVVGVESTRTELHADNIRNGTPVLDGPCLVVASHGDPAVAVGVVGPHQRRSLLGEGLTCRRPILEREQLVQQGVENPADSLASSAGVVANNGRVGTGDLLALLEVGVDGADFGVEVEDFGSEAVLECLVREERDR